MVALLALLFTRTSLGLRLRASAFAPEVSRLLGVNVGGMLTLGWALASAVGALAAMLVIPTELGLHPHAMDLVFVSAFTAAVVGGLDSPVGAVVGGLVVGLAMLSYAATWVRPSPRSPCSCCWSRCCWSVPGARSPRGGEAAHDPPASLGCGASRRILLVGAVLAVLVIAARSCSIRSATTSSPRSPPTCVRPPG